MKNVTSIRFNSEKLLIDASAAGIMRPIDISQFVGVQAPGKSSLRFVKASGAPFWLYNLSNASAILKGLKKAIDRGDLTYIIQEKHILKEEEFKIKIKLSEALNTAFTHKMDRETFLNEAGCLEVPPYFKANKKRYWKQLLLNTRNSKVNA
jgi:hypothetical protein